MLFEHTRFVDQNFPCFCETVDVAVMNKGVLTSCYICLSTWEFMRTHHC